MEITAEGDTVVIVKDAPIRHILRLSSDPREFGDILWFDVSLWGELAGEPISGPDLRLV